MRGQWKGPAFLAGLPLVAAMALALAACGEATPGSLGLKPWPPGAIGGELVVAFQAHVGADARHSLLAAAGAHSLVESEAEGLTLVRASVAEGLESQAQGLLRGQSGVAYVEPNFRRRNSSLGRVRPLGAGPAAGKWGGQGAWGDLALGRGLLALTNDPFLQAPGPLPGQAASWGLMAVRAPEAWDRTAGEGISVAIIDTGVDLAHPDLAANIDTASAINLVEPGRPAQDDFGHGTHVAGIVAAVANNAQGAVGLAHRARLVPIRVLGVDGTGSSFDSARAIFHAMAKGCKVVNLSLGAPAPSEAEGRAVASAIAAGLVIVAAAGNEAVDGNPQEYPAGYPGVVSVGASGPDGQRAPFSNFGLVTLSAPGVDIFSTIPVAFSQRGVGPAGPSQPYGFLSGTSMASPFVAAAAALTFASHPGWTANQVILQLRKTVRELTPVGDVPGPDHFTGSGQLDAAAAVAN